ncbi:unnamed protein product, partial [Coregonus sp. 'balchen']
MVVMTVMVVVIICLLNHRLSTLAFFSRQTHSQDQDRQGDQRVERICVFSNLTELFVVKGIESGEDLCILYSNRAACYLKDGNNMEALELKPFSLKPLLRRAMAYESMERYRQAYVDFKTVLQIDIGVQAAHDSVHRITKQLIEQDGPDWRQKLPEIPLVPLSAQQHHRQKDPSAELVQAREAKKAEARFASLKTEGNDHVRKSQFRDGIEKAICYLRLGCFEEARQDCDSALKLEPTNKKAFYRRALAFKGLQDYLSSSSDLQEVLQLDPNVQEAEQELETVTGLLRQSLMDGAQHTPRRCDCHRRLYRSLMKRETDGDLAVATGKLFRPQLT